MRLVSQERFRFLFWIPAGSVSGFAQAIASASAWRVTSIRGGGGGSPTWRVWKVPCSRFEGLYLAGCAQAGLLLWRFMGSFPALVACVLPWLLACALCARERLRHAEAGRWLVLASTWLLGGQGYPPVRNLARRHSPEILACLSFACYLLSYEILFYLVVVKGFAFNREG